MNIALKVSSNLHVGLAISSNTNEDNHYKTCFKLFSLTENTDSHNKKKGLGRIKNLRQDLHQTTTKNKEKKFRKHKMIIPRSSSQLLVFYT